MKSPSRMVFDVKNKVALITGGASGIGLCIAKELLRNGLKGVAIADINVEVGSNTVLELEKEFGKDKAIFIETDVTKIDQFEDAFTKTISKFKYVDILVNNAGIYQETAWEKEVAININGVIHGILLGMDKFLPIYKQGPEALIVNVASVMGTQGYGYLPVYCGTKHACLGLTKSWANDEFYRETKVKVIAICPGFTTTPTLAKIGSLNWDSKYLSYHQKHIGEYTIQEPSWVGKEAIPVIKHATNGTIWVIEAGEPAYEYVLPHRSTMKGNTIKEN